MNRRQFLQRTAIAAGGILLPHFPGLAKANYLYLPHRRKAFQTTTCTVSNGNFVNEVCDAADFAGWGESANGDCAWTQATYDTKSTFKFLTGTPGSGVNSHLTQDFGSLDGVGNTIVISYHVYFDVIGAYASQNYLYWLIPRSDWRLYILWCSDNVKIYNGAGWQDVTGVTADVWQEWSFEIDLSSGVANAICDVYLDNVRVAANVDCSDTGTYTDGLVDLTGKGQSVSTLYYIDWFKIGDGWT